MGSEDCLCQSLPPRVPKGLLIPSGGLQGSEPGYEKPYILKTQEPSYSCEYDSTVRR